MPRRNPIPAGAHVTVDTPPHPENIARWAGFTIRELELIYDALPAVDDEAFDLNYELRAALLARGVTV